MRKKVFLIFVFSPLLGFTQEKKFFQLDYKGKPNFKERSYFLRDSIWRFNQTLAYDEPTSFDEEWWSRLTIEVRDTALFRTNKSVNFAEDCLTAKCLFATWNVWAHNNDCTKISGQVQLISVSNEGILLKLDLIVTNLKTNNQYVYVGERMFGNKATISEFYNH